MEMETSNIYLMVIGTDGESGRERFSLRKFDRILNGKKSFIFTR